MQGNSQVLTCNKFNNIDDILKQKDQQSDWNKIQYLNDSQNKMKQTKLVEIKPW